VKTIIFTARAAKEFDALPAKARREVGSSLNDYAVTGRGDVKALKGQGGFRMRVGSYRILFDEDQVTILAITITRRSTTTYRR